MLLETLTLFFWFHLFWLCVKDLAQLQGSTLCSVFQQCLRFFICISKRFLQHFVFFPLILFSFLHICCFFMAFHCCCAWSMSFHVALVLQLLQLLLPLHLPLPLLLVSGSVLGFSLFRTIFVRAAVAAIPSGMNLSPCSLSVWANVPTYLSPSLSLSSSFLGSVSVNVSRKNSAGDIVIARCCYCCCYFLLTLPTPPPPGKLQLQFNYAARPASTCPPANAHLAL